MLSNSFNLNRCLKIGNMTSESIISKWQSVTSSDWDKQIIYSQVLIAQMLPDNTTICEVHKSKLIDKNIRLQYGSKMYGITGKYCPQCQVLYLSNSKYEDYQKKLSEKEIPSLLQPVEDTLAWWNSASSLSIFPENEPIYTPASPVSQLLKCPLHPDEILIQDLYRFSGSINITTFYCGRCEKHILSSADIKKLQEDCSREKIKFPAIRPLKRIPRPRIPSYKIHKGQAIPYKEKSINTSNCKVLGEDDVIVINSSRNCINPRHNSIDTPVILIILHYDGTKEFYTLTAGYCHDCNQYNIDKINYDVIYKLGRPEVSILNETEEDYRTTSGVTFNEERTALTCLQTKFKDKIESNENHPDFISLYATISGGYDDGALTYAKNRSLPYHEENEKLRMYIEKPYQYRVDIDGEDKTRSFYLGMKDIRFNDKLEVMSVRSDLGRALVNYSISSMNIDQRKYQIALRRELDIHSSHLFSYVEQTSSDINTKKGINDPFLAKILKMRKKQNQLLDIIATIQQNQNDIVNQPLSQDMIIQGCAGSGKTMVLLHRLSILDYKKSSFNGQFSLNKVVLLTPNENFNTHITGLIGSLEIKDVPKYSVEAYYKELIRLYSAELCPSNNISDEINLNQTYLDYIYSNEFVRHFTHCYATVFKEYIGNFTSDFKFIQKTITDFQNTSINFKGLTAEECILYIRKLINPLRYVSYTDTIEYKSEQQNNARLMEEHRQLIQEFQKIFPGMPAAHFPAYLELIKCLDESSYTLYLQKGKGLYVSIMKSEKSIINSNLHLQELERNWPSLKRQLQHIIEEQDNFTIVSFYNEVYKMAMDIAETRVKEYYKERSSFHPRGTYRFDLYLRLLFARTFYQKAVAYRHIICVDEGQDMSLNEYRLLLDTHSPRPIFNIYGDTNQLLKKNRGISSWNTLQTLLSRPLFKIFTLNENYRNTNQIIQLCNQLFNLDTTLLGVDGKEVAYIRRYELEQKLSRQIIRNERIAVLLPRTVRNRMKYLNANLLSDSIKPIIGKTMGNGLISILYVDEVKGIEFDRVFVVSKDMSNNEKYVAYTRALSELIIVTD